MAHEWLTDSMGNALWHAQTFGREIVFVDEIQKEFEMTWLKKAWRKIRSVRAWWLIVPLLGASALVVIRRLFRPRPRARVPVISEDRAEAERERVRDHADARREEIERTADDWRRRLDE